MGIDRDERRRRIMERGSDRLALITGQLHTLESSSSSSPSSSSAATHQRAFSESFTTQTRFDDRVTQQSASLKHRTKEESTTEEPPKISPIRQKPEEQSKSTKPVIRNQNQQIRNVFTSKNLNSSIINSEQTRILSSLTMAAMVVFLPRLNILKSESILALRPLCLLLLTNCAIVMSHVTAMEGEEEEKGKSGNNGENWSDTEKVLERGVVAYQVLRAFFIDFSLYIVVVICGLSIF